MAILSFVKDSSILENNIVQTVASAAVTLSAIIFVLPGLVIVGWWTGFPFWQSFLICLSGGVLGVVFTIPLRRALVTNSDLPYPEGVAAAEVLKVGSGTRGETKDDTGEAREGLVALMLGSFASAGLSIVTATRLAAGQVTGFFRLGALASSGYDIAFSLALVGAGHLVGLFFFQAKDGIRDWSVTGVQTCALPISSPHQQKRPIILRRRFWIIGWTWFWGIGRRRMIGRFCW